MPWTLRWPRLHTGEPGNGLPGRRSAVRGHPQDLAAERGTVLCRRAVAGVAGGDVEEAVRPERQPAAVWWFALGMPSTMTGPGRRTLSCKVIRITRLSVGRREVDEDAVVGGEPGGDGDAEQARLTERLHARDGADPDRRGSRRRGRAAPCPRPATSPGRTRRAGRPGPRAP